MPRKKKARGGGYLSPNIERAVRHALVYAESYDSVEQRFPTNERLVRESWDFWSSRVPKGLDEASFERWIHGPFASPAISSETRLIH